MTISRLIAGLLTLAGSAFLAVAEAKPGFPSVGMEQVMAPVSGETAVPVTLWYPSSSAAHPQQFGPYRADVAMGGEPEARGLPLIVMSHGTGGSAFNSIDLAMALAKAGFVVAALEHTGDNHRDRSRSFTRANFVERAHQVSRALDFLTRDWRYKGMIDPARIGMFGHSAGGTTTLIVGGGVLDWRQVIQHCVAHPEVWGCAQGGQQNAARAAADRNGAPIVAADPRVKALVLAAPAVGHGFAPGGLAKVRVPVQLWVAERDTIVLDAGQVAGLIAPRPERHDVAEGGHFSFLGPCPDGLRAAAPEVCAERPGFDRGAFQQQFTRGVVRFFRAHLAKGR